MKTTLISIFCVFISIVASIWVNDHLVSRYFIEEYYTVLNLDPKNEQSAETLREKIYQSMEKNIPARYRPSPDKFQCFKIISEAVFFCSFDTYRKNVAEQVKNFFKVTLPGQIGWIAQGDLSDRSTETQERIKSNKSVIDDFSKKLNRVKKQDAKHDTQIKNFLRMDDLYKKTISLMEKKIDILQQIVELTTNSDTRSSRQFDLEQIQSSLDQLTAKHENFRSQNRSFAETAEQRDMLIQQIDELAKNNAREQKNLAQIQDTLSKPNAAGMVADLNESQFVPDASREKFDVQKNDKNVIWFSMVLFLFLTNFIFRLKPIRMVPFEEDMTMNEVPSTSKK